MFNSNNPVELFTFSTNLWYNNSPRAVSKKDGYVSLYLQVYIGVKGYSTTEEFKLKLRWPPRKIDRRSSILKPRYKGDPDVNDYNILILAERSKHNEIAKIYRLSGKNLSMEAFTRELRLFDYKEALVTYINKKRKELYLQGIIGHQTYKNVGSTVYSILEYQPAVRFDEVDLKWMEKFKAWLRKTGAKPSTVWTKIKDLKRYLKLASEEKLIFVNEEAVRFPNPEPKSNPIFCNREELQRLMRLMDPYYLTPIEYNVLRGFIFTCFTSLRISDLYDAGRDMLLEENLLTFTAYKGRKRTPKRVRIPLIPLVRALIDESLKSFFELPTQQEYNRTLKDLARKADIKKNLTSHVGRHTFGYLWMTTSGNIYLLQQILGHTKISTTEKYAHIDDEYNFQQALLMQRGFEQVAQRGILRSFDVI